MGDVVDGFSIVTTVAGVCTSLGLGAIQIVAGAKRLGWMENGTPLNRKRKTWLLLISMSMVSETSC